MRTTKILSVTLPPAMLSQAERVARQEHRTKSELIREALRRYFLNQEWQQIRAYGTVKAKQLGVNESDVSRLIKEYRTEEQAKVKTRSHKVRK